MLSDNIRKYRKINNLSQDELAEKLGVTRQSISLWENGQTQPTIDNIIALSKLFNISADTLLGNENGTTVPEQSPQTEKKKRGSAPIVITVCIVLAAGLLAAGYFGLIKGRQEPSPIEEPESQTESVEKETSPAATEKTTPVATKKATATATKKATATATKKATAAPTKKTEQDLFTYCKNFAISKGTVNGDYTMYQQPSSLYGGYENEYFSISYWGDSDMVEFCLHCPLDDTFSINFYLRMRGGYDGKYEYLTSRYYRDSGESIRDATGYIDPKTFTENYPLNCTLYEGSTDKQTDFMEESRVGMCDLIKCLKKFVEVEKMDCGFDAFEFSNF